MAKNHRYTYSYIRIRPDSDHGYTYLPLFILTLCLFPLSTTPSFFPCPQPSIFWAQHNAFDTIEPWPTNFLLGNGNKFSENNPIFGGTTSWYEVMKKYNHRTLCRNAASQYISYRLNFRAFGHDNRATNGNAIELGELIETHCPSINTDTSSLKNHVAERLHSLNLYFTLINSNNDGCVLFSSLDCNHNGIKDECEFDTSYSSLKFICDRGNWMSSTFQNCKLDVNMTNQDVCKAIGLGKDCNGNRILDECEISSKSDLPCESVNCLFSPHGERVNVDCTRCHSLDMDGNGVPDTCQDEEEITNMDTSSRYSGIKRNLYNQNSNPNFKPRPNDCNHNLMEDSLDIYLSIEEDRDGNGIPDSCQVGHWCSPDGCIDGSFQDFNNLKDKGKIDKLKSFSHKTSCFHDKTCQPFTKADELGSCCRRTSYKNTKVICQEFIRRDYCISILGGTFNLDPYCSNITCQNPVGSCCRGNVTTEETSSDNKSFCFPSISLDICRKSFSSSYTFDLRRNCAYLCNPPENITGTCIINDKCKNDIHKKDCDNLRGKYDYIPCSDRLDMKEEKVGSCCHMDGTCQDFVSEYDCIAKGDSKFSTSPCKEEGYCHKNLRGFDEDEECCWDEGKLDCYRTKSMCPGKNVKCKTNPFCRLISHFPNGCCMFGYPRGMGREDIFNLTLRKDSGGPGNGITCMEYREDCDFFSGITLGHEECIKMPQCLRLREGENAEDFIKMVTTTTMDSDDKDMEIVEGGNVIDPLGELVNGKRNVTGPQTVQTTEQVVSIAVFSSVFFFIVVLFVGGYYLLKSRYEYGRDAIDDFLSRMSFGRRM